MGEENHDLLITVNLQLKNLQNAFSNHLKKHEKIDKNIEKIDNRIWIFMMAILGSLLGGFGTLIFIVLKRL